MNRSVTINTLPQGRVVAAVGEVYRFLATGEYTNGRYAHWKALVRGAAASCAAGPRPR